SPQNPSSVVAVRTAAVHSGELIAASAFGTELIGRHAIALHDPPLLVVLAGDSPVKRMSCERIVEEDHSSNASSGVDRTGSDEISFIAHALLQQQRDLSRILRLDTFHQSSASCPVVFR